MRHYRIDVAVAVWEDETPDIESTGVGPMIRESADKVGRLHDTEALSLLTKRVSEQVLGAVRKRLAGHGE